MALVLYKDIFPDEFHRKADVHRDAAVVEDRDVILGPSACLIFELSSEDRGAEKPDDVPAAGRQSGDVAGRRWPEARRAT